MAYSCQWRKIKSAPRLFHAPKLPYQRKINLIIYLQEDWKDEWGGHLGIYEHDKEKNAPGKLVKEIMQNLIERYFDTTMNSWHGLCKEVTTPEGVCRKSMAIYYLTTPPENVDVRSKALFAPTKEQESDQDILELIKQRANQDTTKNT